MQQEQVINSIFQACQGCGKPSFHDVCFECVKARHKAVMRRRCSCGRQRRPKQMTNGVRHWTGCLRCLGVVP